jgi:cytochrome c oxidase subunit I+III
MIDLGVSPTATSYGASVWTNVGWMAFHVAFGAGMALWCLARLATRRIDSWRSLTLRICLLWWRYTAPATAIVIIVIAGFPHALR